VPEVARILRPGGRFVFDIASAFHYLCWDDDAEAPAERLQRDYFGMRRWAEESVDFQLPYGEWIRSFRANGLEVEDLIELHLRRTHTSYPWFAPLEWARRFPAENVWKLRRTG
jgi:SAM-dependent methyltransferase